MASLVLLAALAATVWWFRRWVQDRDTAAETAAAEARELASCWRCHTPPDPITHRLRHRPAPRGAEPL